jgi:hypothetical protein
MVDSNDKRHFLAQSLAAVSDNCKPVNISVVSETNISASFLNLSAKFTQVFGNWFWVALENSGRLSENRNDFAAKPFQKSRGDKTRSSINTVNDDLELPRANSLNINAGQNPLNVTVNCGGVRLNVPDSVPSGSLKFSAFVNCPQSLYALGVKIHA